MIKNYYFVATLLPPLKLGSPPELTSQELSPLLEQNLKPQDFEKVTLLRRLTDIENLRKLWKEEPIELGGNCDRKELEENVFFREGLPQYVFDYADKHPNIQEKIRHFPELLHTFFHKEIENTEPGFAKDYLCFEWQWRLIFAAMRAKDLGRDFINELRYENLEDPFVEEILAQRGAKIFEPMEPYTLLKPLYESKKDSPLILYQALEEWKFSYIEEIISWQTFTLTRILGYVAQLAIVEKWLELDKRKGKEFIEKSITTKG